jgi:hypothetical protein
MKSSEAEALRLMLLELVNAVVNGNYEHAIDTAAKAKELLKKLEIMV